MIAILIRIFAISVFGYITATIASYLIGSQAHEQNDPAVDDGVRDELLMLRREVAALRSALEGPADRDHRGHLVTSDDGGLADHGGK